jgi:conjugative relaxase-like TrwC/TraI family protein
LVQTTHKISGDDAPGFASYLTSSSARGDYYAGQDDDSGGGEGVVPQSAWHGSPAMLASLGIAPDRAVEREQLLALMRGVSPADGRELRRAGGNGTRVAGIDMTFSAPKTVSALWAVSSPYERARIEAAHSRAVAGALERVERDVELVRSRRGGELRWERARRLVAAEFVHTSSRLTRAQESGGVPDPQLHSHVVVLGAERRDGRFAAVDSRELFRSARANGAWYRAELAHELGGLGLEIEGGTGRDGRYFEIKGVPRELAERWSARSADIERAAREFRTRYGRDPRAGELGSLTVATRGTKTRAAAVDVNAAWRAVGAEHGLTREQAQNLYGEREQAPDPERDLAGDLLRDVVRDRSLVSERDLHARAYELSAGIAHPARARDLVSELERAGELVPLEGGMWTTRELRECERETVALAESRVGERAAPVSAEALEQARARVERDLGGGLSSEQREALATITGEGGVTVLVGQAGTGKGVVLGAASAAWRSEEYEVIGTAVAGETAERLGADAKTDRVLTTDALIARVQSGGVRLGRGTVVVMDEAGMADTKRLARVVELTAQRESKLVLVGDGEQLSPIGAGGLFTELRERVPSAELTEVHRARHEWERQAWAQVRDGRAERALASYQAMDRLHIADTREQAARQMVAAWDRSRHEAPEGATVMITDASNRELDRINALAQEARAANGELGSERVELQDRPYALAAGDQVIFTAACYPPGEKRVENGTRGTVAQASSDGKLTIQTRGASEREVKLDTAEFQDLRLGYAQHVYKAQGLTTQRAHVLLGGWQTDRQRAYVALSRAREQTDIYASREDLGEQGMDSGAIERLAAAMSESHAQQASIARAEATRDPQSEHGVPADLAARQAPPPAGERESEAARIMRESHEHGRGQPAPELEQDGGNLPDTSGELGPGIGADHPNGPDPGHESEASQIMRESQQQLHEQDRDRDRGLE